MAAPYDRITQLLQSQAVPKVEPLDYVDSANSLLSALNGGDYSTVYRGRQQENYQNARQMQSDEVSREMGILDIFERQKAAGDANARALDEKIKLFTGDDPEGMAIFLQALNDDPEDIDPGNSYQVMTKLAGIAKRTGYKSPAMKQKETMDSVNKEIMNRLGTQGDKSPLSVRNNNPGNMRPVGGSGFQAFSSPQEGLAAMANDLGIKISGKSKAMETRFGKGYQPTLANVISTWAPPTENDTAGYVNFVSQKTGLAPDQILSPTDVQKLIPAMIEMEGGREAAQYYNTAPTGMETAQNTAQMNDGFDEITELQVMTALSSGDTEKALKLMADAQEKSNKIAEPLSTQGKLEQDYRKGLITKETYDATVKKENADVESVVKAKKSFDAVLDKISEKLDFLDKEGAIVNQNKNPPGPDFLYNAAVNVGNTGIGQAGARMIGTKAQGARDSIVSLKRTLTPLLMKATGMSSQQLNSNVELMTFLDSLGNPMSSLQTNKDIIDTLRQLYGSGSTPTKEKTLPAPQTFEGFTIERVD